MENIFEYYTLTLTAKSPVFVGSGETVSKKEYCYDYKSKTVFFMKMDKLIEHLCHNDNYTELFEKFMIDENSLPKNWGMNSGKKKVNNTLDTFLDYILMNQNTRNRFVDYEIKNADLGGNGCNIEKFMRSSDGGAYIPGSSLKGMLRTAILQYIIRQKRDMLPDEKAIDKEEDALNAVFINNLGLKNNDNDAVNSIMRGISISDSEPIPNKFFTVCRKIDLPCNQKIEKDFRNLEEICKKINTTRECIIPGTEVTFHIKVDKRYFLYMGKKFNVMKLFDIMIKKFDIDYREFYLSKFPEIDSNKKDFESGFLVLGGGSGYFGKNIMYTRYGFDDRYGLDEGLKKVSAYMAENGQKNGNDYELGISPHMLKLTKYNYKLYHMGICSVKLERNEF